MITDITTGKKKISKQILFHPVMRFIDDEIVMASLTNQQPDYLTKINYEKNNTR